MDNNLYKTFLIFSSFITTFSLLSLIIKDKLYISETVCSFLYGLLLSYFDILTINDKDNRILFHFSRILMSLQVVAVGIYVPKRYIRKEKLSLFYFLLPIMTLSYLISSSLIYLVLYLMDSQLSWPECFITAACITPTDPVLASCILKGKFASKYIPAHLRNLLMVESGANDGLGWLFLSIPLLIYKYIQKNPTKFDIQKYMLEFLLRCFIKEILLSILLGFILGYLFKTIYLLCKTKHMIDKESNLAFLLVITTFSIGLNTIWGLDDILSLFILGLTFTYGNEHIQEIKEVHLLEVIDLLFTLNFFILFGLNLNTNIFTLPNTIIGTLLILFRRLPLVFLFKDCIPQLFCKKEALICGWFGPIGVGAIFFALEALHTEKGLDRVFEIVQVVVSFSIVVHGITAPFVHLHLKRSKSVIDNKKVDEVDEDGGMDSEYTSDIDGEEFDVLIGT